MELQHEAIKQKLEERYAVIKERLGRISVDLRRKNKPLDSDSQEQAIELQNDQVLEALDDSMRDELTQIEKTLERIESGDYGICERCDKKISIKRLEALPHTSLCVKCADKNSNE